MQLETVQPQILLETVLWKMILETVPIVLHARVPMMFVLPAINVKVIAMDVILAIHVIVVIHTRAVLQIIAAVEMFAAHLVMEQLAVVHVMDV